jgi:hypothetical protein
MNATTELSGAENDADVVTTARALRASINSKMEVQIKSARRYKPEICCVSECKRWQWIRDKDDIGAPLVVALRGISNQ